VTGPSNVVEVDFRPPKDPVEQLEDFLGEIRVELDSIRLRLERLQYEGRRWEREQVQLRRRLRELEQELVLERRNQFADADVLEAFQVTAAGKPLAATVVARRLFPNEPTHSAVVRVGLALGRLADAGHIIRIPSAELGSPNRWKARAV